MYIIYSLLLILNIDMQPFTFFTKQSLKYITPYIQARKNMSNTNNKQLTTLQIDAIKRFPLFVNYHIYKKGQIKFYEKYFSSSVYKELFTKIITVLTHKNSSSAYKQALQCIEPTLHNKIKQITSLNKSQLAIDSIEIQSTKIISQQTIHGVFIHRQLNMPSECYSVQNKKQHQAVLRMRNKFNREEHIQLLEQKQTAYNANDYKLQRYYMDSYLNFTKKQKINRFMIQVNANIKGKLISSQANAILPINSDLPVTSHLMQVETIDVPGRAEIEKAIVTDIDFFMNGNPFVS